MSDERRAVVLGGGGVTGVAWEIGMIHGLAERGVDLSRADLFVGTSAGSVVSAQITAGVPLDQLYALELADTSGDRNARISRGVILRFAVAGLLPGARGRAWLGRAALRARTVPEAERRAAIASRVTSEVWPGARLRIPAVAAATGQVVVFDNDSGVPLVDAVAASCAVPLVWPPMTVAGTRYIDGGMRSIANVDLATGYGRVVVLAPANLSVRRSTRPSAQTAALAEGVRRICVQPSATALDAIGDNPLSPERRAAAAEAGHAQSAEAVDAVRAVWG
ncbi:patatin-like phospholipase family protein [Actinoplanes sp. NPDC049265]|uniref:patatin-like phospholipase family protein n=1 Tax=Actinoplanes sp. NPDC049265 TaxID=3363902 RepID=UPI003714C26D